MIYVLALIMGFVIQTSYLAKLTARKVGHGFGSPWVSILASLGAGSFLLCVIPTAVYIGVAKGILAGIGFAVASFIGNLTAGFVHRLLGFYVQRLIAMLGLPINIALAFSVVALV